MERITLAAARRIALAAQGFGAAAPATVTMRQLQREVDRLAQFQIDSVNVAVRAHYMPLYSRVGAYDLQLLERAFASAPRRLYEYWGHAASLIDVALEPALRWRQERALDEAWGSIRRIQAEHPQLVAEVYHRIQERPMTAREVGSELGKSADGWGWNWSAEKTALEWLFYTGHVTSRARTTQFERIYDIPARVIPSHILATPTAPAHEQICTLIRRSAAALGIGTQRCLSDYFRIPAAMAKPAIAALVTSAELVPIAIEGWSTNAYLWHQARRPRAIHADALVSPFDSLVFERSRLEQLFGIHYRIGIYTPAAQRTDGYYVYLFVCDDEIAARVDLKADRARGALLVQGSWRDSPRPDLVPRLRAELERMASWLGLREVVVAPVGDLAADLA